MNAPLASARLDVSVAVNTTLARSANVLDEVDTEAFAKDGLSEVAVCGFLVHHTTPVD